MNKEPKESKMTVQELHKKLENIGKTANEYKTHFQRIVSKRPLEAAIVIFLTGLMSGILVRAVRSRRR